ncbi:hypothetical protein JCGZ_12237 [Jatropha curcas]|uniref:Pentacotripeptide-repeat region of PRORP domain-containing protein n=2 Tax=Jatropha curcas TaxID=180498 RepID=A0A067K6D9_JATCU|nr:hypothetical protein JCGZ_12237 [Jatropha curcas]
MIFHGEFLKHHLLLQYLLHVCSTIRSLDKTKSLHALTVTLGPNTKQSTFLHNNIIKIYASLNELPMAQKVFENMPQKNIVSYNSIISSYCKYDYLQQAWRIFGEMTYYGFRPNNFTFAGLLSFTSMDIYRGFQLQAFAVKNGLFYADAFVGTALMGLFGRCERVDEAFRVFEDMPAKSLVTWNSMISLFGHQDCVEDCMRLFSELVRKEGCLSEFSVVAVLSGLLSEKDMEYGEQIHGLVIKRGFDYKVSVVNSLINMYAKCASIRQAEKLFEVAACRDIVTWNTIIGALAKGKKSIKALQHFLKMSKDGIMPNQTTFGSLISSCADLQILMYGKFVHAKTIVHALETDVYVGSAWVDYYAKCDKLDDARHCFFKINGRNVVSWNSLILGFANKGSSISISLLLEMLQLGYRPNEFSFSAVLKSSSIIELQQLHCLIIRMGYEINEFVLSSLISSYGRNGLISDALVFLAASESPLAAVPSNNLAGILNKSGQYQETLKLLSQLEEPDDVSWNIVIAACARNGNYKEAFELFKRMLMGQIYPDNYTYVSLLSVCSKICDLALGCSVHGLLIKTNFSSCDVFVCNVLIDMYGKCGCPGRSVKIFNSMTNRNLITWTALISALGINGRVCEALERFREMKDMGFRPDKVAFIAALSACRHGALVREGIQFFEEMISYGIEPDMDHYHCFVDLLARHGHVKEAEKVISCMPFPPNARIWRSFLEGCKRYRTKEDQVLGM